MIAASNVIEFIMEVAIPVVEIEMEEEYRQSSEQDGGHPVRQEWVLFRMERWPTFCGVIH
jgi:hypothetical protein